MRRKEEREKRGEEEVGDGEGVREWWRRDGEGREGGGARGGRGRKKGEEEGGKEGEGDGRESSVTVREGGISTNP